LPRSAFFAATPHVGNRKRSAAAQERQTVRVKSGITRRAVLSVESAKKKSKGIGWEENVRQLKED
jgi:hypothetical protein